MSRTLMASLAALEASLKTLSKESTPGMLLAVGRALDIAARSMKAAAMLKRAILNEWSAFFSEAGVTKKERIRSRRSGTRGCTGVDDGDGKRRE